ncbi:MAG: hypothetical protein ABIZ81_09015 [Opitutaceae bacterium]
MSTTSVFATATSTMHADLIVVALKRVGIPTLGISILYPSHARPDSVLYWVDGATQFALSATGDAVTVSGPLRFALERYHEGADFPSLAGGLRSLGLSAEQSAAFEATLLEDRVLLCIESADENELALIFHILHHIGAEKIVLTEIAPTRERTRRRGQQARRAAGTALSLSAA